MKGLAECGLKPYPGEANYVFFEAPSRGDLMEALLAKGILIRHCNNYEGLDDRFYRVAVKKPEENKKLVEILKSTV